MTRVKRCHVSAGTAVIIAAWAPISAVYGACTEPVGDVTGDGVTNVTDVQCDIVALLWELGGNVGPQPGCLSGPLDSANVDCNDVFNVADVQVVVATALAASLPAVIDADGNGCPDACEIEVPCTSDADCFDGNGCTVDQCVGGLCGGFALATCDGPTAIHTTIAGHPTAAVPGFPGQEFTDFDRPALSPSGGFWALTADNGESSSADEVLLLGTGITGEVILIEDAEVPFEADSKVGAILQRLTVTDEGSVIFGTNLDEADTATDETMLLVDADGVVSLLVREGDPIASVPGAVISGTVQPAGWVAGEVAFETTGVVLTDGSEADILLWGASLIAQSGVTPVAGLADGASAQWQGLDTSDYFFNADGSQVLLRGDTDGPTSQDDIVALNNTAVVQEGRALPGFASAVDGIDEIWMGPTGGWLVRGDNEDGGDWVIWNGAPVAVTGGPITPGATEVYSDALFGPTFVSMTTNAKGDYVLGGSTDQPDTAADVVMVLNGISEILREGDPVDLDGNGAFDDGAFIDEFDEDDLVFTDDMQVILTAELRDAAGAPLGQALLVLPATPGPGTCDTNADCGNAPACTSGTCNTATGHCEYAPLDCSDSNPCTTDYCAPSGVCVNAPIQVNTACNDGNACTQDSCDPVAGCESDIIAGCCGNELCDGAETCATCIEDCGGCVGGCCEAKGSAGCEALDCQSCVCAIDSFCCGVSWDDECAISAVVNCAEACPECDPCGDGFCSLGETCGTCPEDCGGCAGDCCSAQPEPGCGLSGCLDCVCEVDFFCCALGYDSDCVAIAETACLGACGCSESGLVPTVVASAIPGDPTSIVPGLGGVEFVEFDAVYGSPDGSRFALRVDLDGPSSADQAVIVGDASTLNTSVAVREGDPAPWNAGTPLGSFGNKVSVSSDGDIAFGTNTSEDADFDEYVIRGNVESGVYQVVAQEGLPIETLPGGTWGGDMSLGDVLDNGAIAFMSEDINGLGSLDVDSALFIDTAVIAQKGVDVPAGQSGGSSLTWESFDSNDFDLDAFGTSWIVQGDLTGPTDTDDVAVVDGVIVLQQGASVVGAFSSPMATIEWVAMDASGRWGAFGDNEDNDDWVVIDSIVVASTGLPIHPGAAEVWDDSELADGFRGFALGAGDDYVIVGTTNNPDPELDEVVVLNGESVLLREGDAVDVDGDGNVGDAFVGEFDNEELALLPSGILLINAILVDTAGAELGEALLAIGL